MAPFDHSISLRAKKLTRVQDARLRGILWRQFGAGLALRQFRWPPGQIPLRTCSINERRREKPWRGCVISTSHAVPGAFDWTAAQASPPAFPGRPSLAALFSGRARQARLMACARRLRD